MSFFVTPFKASNLRERSGSIASFLSAGGEGVCLLDVISCLFFVDLLEVVELGYVLRWFGGWQLLDQASRDYHFRNPATLKVEM